MARIFLKNASLTFQVRQMQRVQLKEYLIKRLFMQSVNPVLHVNALQDISFHLCDGDRLGIIGHNGAGKSTMLKLLAGIYPPTSGVRLVEGRVSSLFDLVLGFEPEASGWENIAFRSYLQGESPKTVKAKMQEIADFSELEERFLNMPVRYYSSGMTVRLAFAIATAIEPEILIIDEVLSVGDMSFQNKARQRMRQMSKKARILVLVTHDLTTLPQICDRVLWLDHGRQRMLGPAAEVIEAYKQSVPQEAAPQAA
jgi:ABC-type polysaccharide/polyol phosphate transport system ATPase subunit